MRFLWLQEPPAEAADERQCIIRMCRVVFGVSSSPFLLAATIRNHIEQYEMEQPHTVQALRDFLYVDNFISSSSGVDKAYLITTTAKEILSHGNMNLCKFS